MAGGDDGGGVGWELLSIKVLSYRERRSSVENYELAFINYDMTMLKT
jgi:hypothetical protein